MTRWPNLLRLLTGEPKPKPLSQREILQARIKDARRRHAPTKHLFAALRAETEKELKSV